MHLFIYFLSFYSNSHDLYLVGTTNPSESPRIPLFWWQKIQRGLALSH